jgi:hypothetical protein
MTIEPRKASFGLTFLLGALVFCIFALIASLWFRVSPTGQTYDEIRAAKRLKSLSELRAVEERKLKNYDWVDKDKGVVQIPIARAMDLVLADLQSKQVHASTVAVENPYPYGLQPAPAASAASAAPASPEQTKQKGQ